MKYLLNCRSFISLMVLFSFFDNFGMETEENNSVYSFDDCKKFKIIFVGDTGVGKTQIINKFVNSKFDETYDSTIGVDFMSKNITFHGTNIKLQMWDTAGQEKYKGLIPSYVRNSSIVFLIYNVSVKKSFDNIPNWISFIKSHESPTLVLCGNKIDLEKREVTKEEGENLAKKEKIAFFEVSAKTGDGIKNMFYSSVADLLISKGDNLNKKNLVKELLQENENENVKSLILNYNHDLNTERSSLCSRCIDCCKNCFNSDKGN